LSYREICATTGFTYTKVNRCLTEGRLALAGRLAGIEEGAECARLAPLLSALADGEADAAALARLRPHLKTCLSCRARLREYRAAPKRVAALVPAALLAPPSGRLEALASGVQAKAEALAGWAQQKAEAALGATHHKAAALSERAQTAAEIVTGQKVAALAASAAALAGGGTAVDQLANHHGPPRTTAVVERKTPGPADEPRPETISPTPSPAPQAPAVETTASPPAEATPPVTPPDPANEFDASAVPAAPTASPATVEPAQPARAVPAPSAKPQAPPGAGEFSP
jgi:hypothetical protein